MSNLVYIITVAIESLLVFRAVFKLFGASATTVIVEWLYKLTDKLVQPFQSIFHVTHVGNYFIEWSTIVALCAIGIVSFLLTEFFNMLTVRFRK
jgi:uncharacterized protein YggT (Ycf19 family)